MNRRFLVPVVVLLLPVAGFVYLMHGAVAEMAGGGESRAFIFKILAGLGGLALIEIPLLRLWVLPKWGQAIGERLYGGGYMPADDAVVTLAEEVRRTKDAALLPQLERLVQADTTRLRGWRELADVQQYVFGRAEDALQTLLRAADSVRDKEERAMLLCRAAHLARESLSRPEEASRLYALAAERYPKTVYGRKAAKELP